MEHKQNVSVDGTNWMFMFIKRQSAGTSVSSLKCTFTFWIYVGLERKLAIFCINFSNRCLIQLWEHHAMVLCVSPSPSSRMHPSEMRPCSHRRCGDEGGSSHPQEVKCRHTACGQLNKQLLSLLDLADFSSSFTVLCLSGIAVSFTNTVCLWHAGWLREGWRWLVPREEWVHKLISCAAECLRALSLFICCVKLFFHTFFGHLFKWNFHVTQWRNSTAVLDN